MFSVEFTLLKRDKIILFWHSQNRECTQEAAGPRFFAVRAQRWNTRTKLASKGPLLAPPRTSDSRECPLRSPPRRIGPNCCYAHRVGARLCFTTAHRFLTTLHRFSCALLQGPRHARFTRQRGVHVGVPDAAMDAPRPRRLHYCLYTPPSRRGHGNGRPRLLLHRDRRHLEAEGRENTS